MHPSKSLLFFGLLSVLLIITGCGPSELEKKLQDELTKAESSKKELTSKLGNVEKELADTKTSLEKLQTSLTDVEADVSQLNTDKTTLEEQLATARDSSEKAIQALQAEKQALQTQLTEVTTESTNLESDKAKLEAEGQYTGAAKLEIARRFGTTEAHLRQSIFRMTNGMYPELITRPDIHVFLPPIGGLTIYIWGDPDTIPDEDIELTCRVHDECNGSDVFGSGKYKIL